MQPEEGIGFTDVLLDAQAPAVARQKPPGRHHVLAAKVDHLAISLLALGGPLGRQPLGRADRNGPPERRIPLVSQRRGDQHVVALSFTRDDLARNAESAEIGENLPDALGADSERQHTDHRPFVDDRGGHERHVLPCRAMGLKATEFGLQAGA